MRKEWGEGGEEGMGRRRRGRNGEEVRKEWGEGSEEGMGEKEVSKEWGRRR